MSDPSEKIKKSREVVVTVRKMKFFARRLTWLEWVKVRNGAVSNYEALFVFNLVNGWDDVREKDIFAGGSNDKVEFDREIFNTAIEDMPEAYTELVSSITKHTETFFEKRGENEKNSQAG